MVNSNPTFGHNPATNERQGELCTSPDESEIKGQLQAGHTNPGLVARECGWTEGTGQQLSYRMSINGCDGDLPAIINCQGYFPPLVPVC